MTIRRTETMSEMELKTRVNRMLTQSVSSNQRLNSMKVTMTKDGSARMKKMLRL